MITLQYLPCFLVKRGKKIENTIKSRHIREKCTTFTARRLDEIQCDMKFRITAILTLACCMVSMAQTTITTYTPGVSAEGAAYYLPKTALNISITVEKTTYTPGELCQYAERYLRISNISDKEDSYYAIKSATITAEGLPDESKLYHILFASNSIAPLVNLTESGILQSVNVATSEMSSEAIANPPMTLREEPLSARSYMTEEMLMTGSKAKLAELVAKEIYNIRESRNLIIRGQNEYMPKDAESLQIILAGLEEQEQAFTQLFTGVTITDVATKTYQVVPEATTEKVVLGRFSRKLGLLQGDDLAGAPIYIDVVCKQVVPAPVAEVVQSKGKVSKKKENLQDGLVYNVPGKAKVKIYTNAQVLAEEMLPLGQLGGTETLSSTLLTKKKNVKVTLDPITGALLKVEE